MEVITAPESFQFATRSVFLAGGITDCPWWQDEIINLLKDESGILYNPRRKDFPIGDSMAAKEQIAWEFWL